MIAALVLAACLFGAATRPAGLLAAFWPANALLLGVFVRWPALATPLAWIAAACAFLAADLLIGGALRETLLLTAGNLSGIIVGFALFMRLSEDDRRLRGPLSVLHMAAVTMTASAAAGLIGALINPFLYNGSMLGGFGFWWISELANYIAILPLVLTLPDFGARRERRRGDDADLRLHAEKAAPVLALALSCAASAVVSGPGAVAFPVPALLWCALVYSLPVTAAVTVAFSVWTLLALANGVFIPEAVDLNSRQSLMSIRLGVALMALAPITVASVMSARDEALRRLEHLAAHDGLTNTLNRRAFCEKAESVLAKLTAARRPVAVLMLDLDGFKAINDTYGHPAGDLVLKAFARRARDCLRESDIFARLGGEEFAVLMADCRPEEAETVADRIRLAFAGVATRLPDNRSIAATVSIGVAFAPCARADLSSLLSQADKALYRAKEAGRNRVEYDEAA